MQDVLQSISRQVRPSVRLNRIAFNDLLCGRTLCSHRDNRSDSHAGFLKDGLAAKNPFHAFDATLRFTRGFEPRCKLFTGTGNIHDQITICAHRIGVRILVDRVKRPLAPFRRKDQSNAGPKLHAEQILVVARASSYTACLATIRLSIALWRDFKAISLRPLLQQACRRAMSFHNHSSCEEHLKTLLYDAKSTCADWQKG